MSGEPNPYVHYRHGRAFGQCLPHPSGIIAVALDGQRADAQSVRDERRAPRTELKIAFASAKKLDEFFIRYFVELRFSRNRKPAPPLEAQEAQELALFQNPGPKRFRNA